MVAGRWLLVVGAAALLGCQEPQRVVPEDLRPDPRAMAAAKLPAYAELAQRYNANLAALDQLWARTKVKLMFRDEDGEIRRQDGEGHFIMRRPMNVYLSVGKLLQDGLLAGTDGQRYWLFDSLEDVAYVGELANVGRPCSQPLPLGVRPQDVLLLLGLVPLDPSAPAPAVEELDGYALVEPPGLPVRYLLNPQTALPVRADLVGPDGSSLVIARLSEPQTVRVQGVVPAGWPRIMSRAEFYLVGEEARLTLDLSDPSDARAGDGTVRDAQFDFERLQRAYDPDEVIDLDAACR